MPHPHRIFAYVVHWNAPEWCADTVQSLLASRDVELHLTVIDNDSMRVPDLPASVELEQLSTNTGFAGAANHALSLFRVRSSPGDLCCITSHDLSVEPDALHRCAVAMQQEPAYGVLGLNGEGLDGGGNMVIERPWVSGTCLVLRPECIADVGLFDETYGSYVEDIDYCYRARDHGWRMGIVAGARATARGSSDAGRAVVLTRANHTLLAAKRGEYGLVAKRVLGMTWRAATVRGERWPASLLQTLRQLLRWLYRTRFGRSEA